MARLALYALGGGLGHTARMLGLAREATARGHRVHAWINASRLPDEAIELAGLTVHRVPETTSREVLVEWLAGVPEADVWIVDVFPRGLLGELGPRVFRGAKTLWIHRDLTPAYALRPEVLAAARAFDRVVVPGEAELAPLADQVDALRIPPILVSGPESLLERGAARARLGAEGERPLVVVSGAGTDAEGDTGAELAAQLAQGLGERATVRWVTPHGATGSLRVWPLLPLLPGVDLLVGAGGYHTVYEARATATPLLALPRPRRYDRQALRLHPGERVDEVSTLVERARVALAKPRPAAPPFESGARAAIDVVEGLLAGNAR